MHFPSFSLENKLFWHTPNPFLPVEALEFSELQTPLVYTFFLHPKLESQMAKTPQNQWSRSRAVSRLVWTPFCVANPFSPYSIQKRPEPQICPKFVPTIIFGGGSLGDWKLSKFVKICSKMTVFQILTNLWQILVPLIETPKIWGSGCFWML